LAMSFVKALRNRPTFKVHFGERVDLSDLSADRPGDAVRAHQRIMRQIAANLAPLRGDELDKPRLHERTRPTGAVSPCRPSRRRPRSGKTGREPSVGSGRRASVTTELEAPVTRSTSRARGTMLIVVASVCFGTSGPFAKPMMNAGFSPEQV